jgi:hypothetical protein
MSIDLGWGSPDERFGLPYFCPSGHDFTVQMTVSEAAVATLESCPTCGMDAYTTPPGETVEVGDLRARPGHWQQVRERRTPEALQELLAWALGRMLREPAAA